MNQNKRYKSFLFHIFFVKKLFIRVIKPLKVLMITLQYPNCASAKAMATRGKAMATRRIAMQRFFALNM